MNRRGRRPGGGGGRGMPGNNKRGVFTKLLKDKGAEMRNLQQAKRFLQGMETYDSKAELLSVLQNNLDNGMARVRDMFSFINSVQDVEDILITFLGHIMTEETNRPGFLALRNNMLLAVFRVPALLDNLVARNVAPLLRQPSAERLCSFLRYLTKAFLEPRNSNAVRTLAKGLRDRGDVNEARTLCIFLLLDETEEGARTAELQRVAYDTKPPQVACWVTDREPPGGRHDNDYLNYRDVRIIPTVEELACPIKPYLPLASGENNFIEDPVASLLDRNFRLLREDAISSMRDNLADADTKCWKNARVIDLKVFTKRPSFSVAFIVQCDPRTRGKTDWKRSRALMHGSVVAFCRGGRPVRMGTIMYREDEIKDEWLNCPSGPRVGISFEMGKEFVDSIADMVKNCGFNDKYCEFLTDYHSRDANDPHRIALEEQLSACREHLESFDLVEVSKSFFSYKPILKTLQQMDDIPFADELVATGAGFAPKKPEYLPDEVILSMTDSDGKRCECRCDLNRWRSDNIVETTSLDLSQAEALGHSLTSRVVLIQGPPGTGKTFLGALVARAIRKNTDATILCVCYTNHALDQFLEHMLDAGENRLVRMGGRSKSERMKELQLKSLARKESRADSFAQKRMKQVHAQLFKLQEEIEENIKIFKVPLGWKEPCGGVCEFLHLEEPNLLDFLRVPGAESDGFKIVGPKNKDLPKDYLWKCWQDGQGFPEWLRPHMKMRGTHSPEFEMFWRIAMEERLTTIDTWRRSILETIAYDLTDLIEKFNTLATENKSLCHEQELQILRSARIIGATTSGAATNHDLLSSLAAEVIIGEEAGEVLESHILSALSAGNDGSKTSKHLILIGDHKQLPPKVENYDLTTTSRFGYNLDCSLFERLVLAGRPSVTLEVQHRMRPSISNLIRAQTYPSLQDHASVSQYPDVKGVSENLVFIDHSHKEDGADADRSTTKSNRNEAELCLEIVRFLLLQGYRTDQIVILTPYLGQLLLIMSKMKAQLKDVSALVSDRDLDDLEDLDSEEANNQAKPEKHEPQQGPQRGVRCSSIDNYQGEEADVVVISLVRSNKRGNIGFLKEPQRVNVLLSRARHGMFLVGNAATLKASKNGQAIWEPLLEEMSRSGRVLKGLPTTCLMHPDDKPVQLCRPDDFRTLRPNGGCIRPCGERMSCGHACPLACHPTDRNHQIAQRNCCEPCRRFPPGCDQHPCTKLCKEDCGPCKAKVGPVTLLCGHIAQAVRCHQASSEVALTLLSQKCREQIVHRFEPCGHEVMTTCSNSKLAQPECPEKCGVLARCSHPCGKSCGSCNGEHECKQVCSRSLFCGHVCEKPCHEPEKCPPCSKRCASKCIHSKCPKKCCLPCSSCVEECDWKCIHEGSCQLVCSAPCSRLPCNQRCSELLSCGHRCPSICGEDCPDQIYCQECGAERYKNQVVDMINLSSYGEHDINNDPVLFLPCGHFFAASTLDGHIEIHKVYEMNFDTGDFMGRKLLQGIDVNEKAKQCPDCRAVIHSVKRYGRILRLVELRSLERKHMATSSQALKTIRNRLEQSANESILPYLDKLEQSIRMSPMRRVYEACGGSDELGMQPPSPPPAPLIQCLELRGMAYGQWAKQDTDANYQGAKQAFLAGICVADETLSLQSGARLRLSLAKITLRCCTDVDEIRRDVNDLLDWIMNKSQLPSSDPLFLDAKNLKDELSKMSKLETIRQVMKAMSEELSRGHNYGGDFSSHWYECPNGHPYFIGECGGAMQESTCPECRVRVGGSSHQSAEGNRHVTGVFRDALSD